MQNNEMLDIIKDKTQELYAYEAEVQVNRERIKSQNRLRDLTVGRFSISLQDEIKKVLGAEALATVKVGGTWAEVDNHSDDYAKSYSCLVFFAWEKFMVDSLKVRLSFEDVLTVSIGKYQFTSVDDVWFLESSPHPRVSFNEMVRTVTRMMLQSAKVIKG